MRYDLFIQHLAKMEFSMVTLLSQKGMDFNSYYAALPPQVFHFLWVPLVERYGFASALPLISQAIDRFLICLNKNTEDQQLRKKQREHLISMIFPMVLTYKNSHCLTQEIINRAKEMKKAWKIGYNICSHAIFFLQCNEEKENEVESKKLKTISDLLLLFDTNQSRLDYKASGLQLVYQSVGESVYNIKVCDLSVEEIYKKLCTVNRDKFIYFLSKIKRKEATFAAILEEITAPSNNRTDLSRIVNICALFLVSENWERFKDPQSKLKDQIVIQILAEAFERLFYLAYSEERSIGLLLLTFLQNSKIFLHEQVRQSIAYHLLALYKFYLCWQKISSAKLVERIWVQKMKDVKMSEMYCEYSPQFVTKTQWCEERVLEQAQTKSINSRSSNSQMLTMRSNRTSKSKGRSTRTNNLNKRLRCIEEDLRRCSFEKIYLLAESLKRHYLDGTEESGRNSVVIVLILLIKKMEGKLDFRYKCSLLKKAIYLQLMELKEKCFAEHTLKVSQRSSSLGLFQCCYVDRGDINLEAFIKFHQKNNYEDTLETVFALKALQEEANSNNLSGCRLDNFEEQLSSLEFEWKVYLLFKGELNETKKIEAKKLIIICKLLLLRSANITNDLLVNYVYLMLKPDRPPEATHRKKIEAYSKLINAEITNHNNSDHNHKSSGPSWQRVRLFLTMGQIFQEFNEQSFKLIDSSIANKYFEFLRRKEHSPYYDIYSQIYLSINHLKESLYFLQLHAFALKTHPPAIVHQAIRLYERLSNPFRAHLKSILKELNIEESQLREETGIGKKEEFKFSLELLVLKMKNQIQTDCNLPNHYEEFYERGSPRFDLWVNYYYRYLQFVISEVSRLKEWEEINQQLQRYAVLTKYLHLKLEMQRQQNLTVTYNDLRNIVELIQRLRNGEDRTHFYLHFLDILQTSNEKEAMEDIYLQNLLACGKHQEVLAYLQSTLGQGEAHTRLKSRYLCFLIKYHFQRGELDRCLSMIAVLAERKEKVGAQVWHMQLECRYKIMLNYTIEEYLGLINKCIGSSSPSAHKETREMHFKYYFKIFRMLFNRYHFTSTTHNELFIQTYFNFIDLNALLTDNLQYLPEAILILLRFIAEKFDYSPVSAAKSLEKAVLEKFKGRLEHFVPFCNYLIKRISFNAAKNAAIKNILKTVLTEHPAQCLWIISFLKNFAFKTQKNVRLSSEEANEMQRLAELTIQVVDTLKARNTLNVDHLSWIDGLVMLSLSQTESKRAKSQSFKQTAVPSQLIFMFNKDYYINRVDDIRVLSNGKSAPLEVVFNLIHAKERHYLTVKVIIKGSIGAKKYRMESNTANFFQEVALLDSDTTYKIIHLSKYLVAIEHRHNMGTLNAIINECLPEFKKVEALILTELHKRKSNDRNEKRLLEIFDNSNRFEYRVRFSQVIYYKARNIKDWWRRNSNFVRTHAQWSYLGYVAGLGDRHCDNILITEDAKLIHIDFEYSLDTGLKLPFPEWVPFRLTSCLVEPLGVLGVYGLFLAEMVSAAKEFQEREDSIWKALSHFVGSMDTNVCEEILQRSRFASLKVGTLQEGVAKLISSAKDPELLRLMFEGWRAYL